MPSLSHLHHTLWNTWAHSGTLVHCHTNLHIVRRLTTLWHRCTHHYTPQASFTLCETLEDTGDTWGDSKHSRTHENSRTLETLEDTGGDSKHSRTQLQKNSALHRPHYMVWSENTVSLYHSKQKLEHRKHCILVSHSKQKTLYPYIHVSLWTENRKHCITLKLYPLFFWSRIILYHWTPFYTTSLYSIVLDCVATLMKW